MPIALAAPTGHIGSSLVDLLLDAGEDLILLTRSPEKLPAGVRDRAHLKQGTLEDADFVAEATVGADALFWLSPPRLAAPDLYDWYETLAQSATRAIRDNGIARVVNLSSEGAHKHEGHGPVSALGRLEASLDATGVHARHLRPTFFMENFEAQLGAIQEAGAVFFPAPPTTTTGMIATRDIAARAADLLRDRSWTGQEVVPLLGPRTYSYEEAARIIGQGIGRAVHAQQVPPEAVMQQILGWGASESVARGMTELYTKIGLDDYAAETRDRHSTTPTTLETYVRDTLRPMIS